MLTSFYPVLMTDRLTECKSFYEKHFGFRAAFESEWYVHLAHPHYAHVNLALLDYAHASIPPGFGSPTRGVLINFEVDDVDAEYQRICEAGLPITLPLRDEPFGQRHFIITDPAGTLVDVIKPIPPSPEFAAMYVS